jgi:protease-4
MRPLALLLLACWFGSPAHGQTFSSYHSTADLSLASPGALRVGLYGFDNPAMLTYLHQPDFEFVWTDAGGRWNDFRRWGMFTAFPNFGFGFVKTKVGSFSVNDYRLALSVGNRDMSVGFGYGFSGGDRAAFDRRNVITLAALLRPDPHFSFGIIGNATTSGSRTEAAFDLGIRPLGNEVLTLFADYALLNTQSLKQGSWSYGAVVEALPGIRVTGRLFSTHAFAVGVSFSFGRVGISTQSTWDANSKHAYNTYALRLGAYDRTVLSKLMKKSHYVQMDLNGGMKYQRFIFFDDSNTLRSTLEAIKAAKEDETVGGIAINTSGMQINREMLWELREQLRDFKASGKKVIIFIDRLSIEEYQFATIADRIVLDPTGIIMLPGYVTGRTFLKGTLEKLGIGYDEWRLYRYKSANEVFSRDRMSEADREQRQKYIDDLYAQTRREIGEGRQFGAERFDQMVNDEVIFLPEEAVQKRLVDTLGRWTEVKAIVEKYAGENKGLVAAASLPRLNLPFDDVWGEPPRIAVIYALGVCAMDEGIKARTLVRDVEAAADDPRVKAIVLRVDSPGGDGMASDYIAEALKKAKKRKPVIVSQGHVAASGGYWLSMYADTIVAAPTTITGSIGVIGGWMYNKELKEKLGLSTDHVKAGKHADLGFGFALPFLGVGIPDRNLTEAERSTVERSIDSFYRLFVAKVAEGRKTTADRIEPLAQGRFYSGEEAKRLGLVDVLGGLEDALRIARTRAGIGPDEKVSIVEFPRPGLLDLSRMLPSPFSVRDALDGDATLRHVRFLLQHNGEPLPLLPLDDMTFDAPTE